METKDFFASFRQSDFFEKQNEYRTRLAHFLTNKKADVETLIEHLEDEDATGKNEIIGKIRFLTGGVAHPPQKVKDAMAQFGTEYSPDLNGPNIIKWQKTLAEVTEAARRKAQSNF